MTNDKQPRTENRRRVLVTGSRGKSSVVRLLHAAMQAAGLDAYARITGVTPRELGPHGTRGISRSAGAHVEEMRWWLGQLPAGAQGIVLENSAIAPEFQALAGRWLQPDITVLTNTAPDHQEAWGPTRACATRVLAAGIPAHGRVVLPESMAADDYLLELLGQRDCQPVFALPAAGEAAQHRAVNLGLALTTLEQMGLAGPASRQAMFDLPRDRYDFHVASYAGAEVAMAFSANDIDSTRRLFESLAWSTDETRLIYNHRADRPGRLGSFAGWLGQSRWRDVLIIGDRPRRKPRLARYLDVENERGLLRLFRPGDRVFGCGNISGLPMTLAAAMDR